MKKHETHYRRHCTYERIFMLYNMPAGSDPVDAQWRLREMENLTGKQQNKNYLLEASNVAG